MTDQIQVLFIQGGGAGTHDEWDNKLVDSLRRELGAAHDIRYPSMPDEDEPNYATWSAAIRHEMAALDAGAVVVGHSVGGTIVINALAEQAHDHDLAAVVLIAAPFLGPGGWPSGGTELPSDAGSRLGTSAIHVFHGLEDEIAPPSHAELYAEAIPQARLHLLASRDHQLNDDLSEVAHAIRSVLEVR